QAAVVGPRSRADRDHSVRLGPLGHRHGRRRAPGVLLGGGEDHRVVVHASNDKRPAGSFPRASSLALSRHAVPGHATQSQAFAGTWSYCQSNDSTANRPYHPREAGRKRPIPMNFPASTRCFSNTSSVTSSSRITTGTVSRQPGGTNGKRRHTRLDAPRAL